MVRRRRPPRAGAVNDLSPLRIVKQICALQAAYYFAATVLIVFTTLVAGKRFTPDLILSWHSLRGDTTVGWTLGLCWMMTSLVGVILLLLLINRSKLVPDFAITVHFIHLVVTSLYTRSLPTNILWWALQACSVGLMISLGIWACQWRELRPMSFGGSVAKAKETPALPHELNGANAGEDDRGDGIFLRMLSRVRRGTVGRGDYELADLEERPEEET